ncbi:MAG: hypothetical protein VZQ83_05195 [Eubacterium sp.]|nr:hypothetical protein [Eubacterium sp.]
MEDRHMEKKKKSKKPLIIIAIILLVLAGGGLGAYLYFVPEKVNLNDYVSVTYAGYDGIGTAEVVFDVEKLKTDLGKTDDENIAKVAETSGAHLSKTDHLTNGDSLELVYFYDNKVAYDSRIQFSGTDETVTVEGLEETEKLDPFKDLKVKVNGIGPFGEAKLKNKSKNPILKGLKFSISPSKNLSMGDKITVKVKDYNQDEFIAKNKAQLTASEAEVEVPVLDQYIVRLDQLSKENLDELADVTYRLGVRQYLRNGAMRPWVKGIDVKQIGTYFLTRKDMNAARAQFKNRYYAVYQMTVKSKRKKGQKGHFKTQTVYMPVEMIDLYVGKSDGDLRDYRNSRLPTAQYTILGQTKINFNGNKVSRMCGFTNLDKLKKYVVTSQKDYNCETEGDLP